MYVSIGRSEINRHEEITLRKMFDGCRSYTKLLSIRVDFPSANTHLQQKKNKRAMLITERTLKQPTKRYSADNSARGKIFGKLCDNATGNCREFQREKGEKEREREREKEGGDASCIRNATRTERAFIERRWETNFGR